MGVRLDRRHLLQATGATIAVAVLGSTANAADRSGAVVFSGGPIHSLTRRGRLSAIAIEGDRIVAVDEAATRLLRRGARHFDLAGRALYPGFIDAHSHWFGDWTMAAQANPAWTDIASPADSVRKAAESGWTTITEHFANEDRLRGLQELDRNGLLPVHVNAYMPTNYRNEQFGDWFRIYPPGAVPSPHLRIAGVKLFLDNAQWHARVPFEPCAYEMGLVPVSDPTYRGRFWWEPAALLARMREIDAAGYQMSIHCIGDAATDIVLDAFRELDPTAVNDRRHFLTHLIVLHDEQIARLRDQNIGANVQLSWMHAADAEALRCLAGPGRLGLIGRWRDLITARVRVSGSTDYPWGVPILGPLVRTLFTATTRIGPNGETPPPWLRAQRLTIQQAIGMLTWRAARTLRQGREKGQLRRGMLADLVIFSEDPVDVPPEELLRLEIAMTVTGGAPVYVNPEHGDLRFS